MKKFFIASVNVIVGIIIGITLFELVLHINPSLLFHGMGRSSPTDPPLEKIQYDVHYSAGDMFIWQSDQVRPIPSDMDKLISHVNYVTDEFGFPNTAPLPNHVDIVVLGRSFSQGANIDQPWPKILAEKTGLKVLNLSQSGSGLDLKRRYLEEYSYPRNPRWVILEVMPSMDIFGYQPGTNLIIPVLPEMMIRQFLQPIWKSSQPGLRISPIYPLSVAISDHNTDLIFYSYYLLAT